MTHTDPLAWKERWHALVVLRPAVVRMHVSGLGIWTTVGLATPLPAENLLESGLSCPVGQILQWQEKV